MVFKMSYGANDVPVVASAAKVAIAKKAPPRRRAKASLNDQAQALFDPPAALAIANEADLEPDHAPA